MKEEVRNKEKLYVYGDYKNFYSDSDKHILNTKEQ